MEPNRVTTQNIVRACGFMLAVAAVIYGGIRVSHHYHANSSLIPATSRGRQAPNFALATPDGKIVHLSEYSSETLANPA